MDRETSETEKFATNRTDDEEDSPSQDAEANRPFDIIQHFNEMSITWLPVTLALAHEDGTSETKKLPSSRMKGEEDSPSKDAEVKRSLDITQQFNELSITFPPDTPSTLAHVGRSGEDETSETKKLASDITEGEEDSTSQDAEAARSLVITQQLNELTITLPPVTPAALAHGGRSNEDTSARQKVKRVLRQFNTLFRTLLHEVESKANTILENKRIDLIVADKLKEAGAFVNWHREGIAGNLPGVEVGDEFGYRVELALVGLHRLYQGAVDFARKDGLIATSVVASLGHSDDVENLDEFVYTGPGERSACGGKNVEYQKLEYRNQASENSINKRIAVPAIRGFKTKMVMAGLSGDGNSKAHSTFTYAAGAGKNVQYEELKGGNLALKNCFIKRTPVRVIFQFNKKKMGLYGNGRSERVSAFRYAGLYLVDDYWQERGPDLSLVCKFKFTRVAGQPALAFLLVKQLKKSEVREGQCVADISNRMERSPICAINLEDDDQPQPFKYITKMKYPSFARAPVTGCACTGCCTDSGSCSCATKNSGEIPYNFNGAIVEAKHLIYECGPACKCSESCPNRVSQHGIRIPLEIFKTKTRGWGVRSLSSIASGTFICEYVGELIDDKEAEKRSNDEYLFDIGVNYEDDEVREDFPDALQSPQPNPSEVEGSASFTIDAAEYANIGRFINHSCTPNMYAQNVLYDHDDKRMPHVMFFAAEHILPLEELTYHYNYAIDQVHDADGNVKRKDCYCGSAECTGRLY